MADVFDDAEGFGDFDGEDIDREWHAREAQFKNLGYRDGLSAGKEASAQEGFDEGFRAAAMEGYHWGQARGVTSAFHILPVAAKAALVGNSSGFPVGAADLWRAVSLVSTNDAGAALCAGTTPAAIPPPQAVSPSNKEEVQEEARVGDSGACNDIHGDSSCCRKQDGGEGEGCCRRQSEDPPARLETAPAGSKDGQREAVKSGHCGGSGCDKHEDGFKIGQSEGEKAGAVEGVEGFDVGGLSLDEGRSNRERILALEETVWREFRRVGVEAKLVS